MLDPKSRASSLEAMLKAYNKDQNGRRMKEVTTWVRKCLEAHVTTETGKKVNPMAIVRWPTKAELPYDETSLLLVGLTLRYQRSRTCRIFTTPSPLLTVSRPVTKRFLNIGQDTGGPRAGNPWPCWLETFLVYQALL